MGLARRPESRLAAEVLPPPLHRALTHVFAQGIDGTMLVGGTALAGYYAGHRRSDDLELLTGHPLAQRATVLSVKSLAQIGCSLAHERSSAPFYHATCRLDGHDFTTQVVLDSNLFRVGSAVRADDGVVVADLETLLKMKASTLVSRASEKDLYDLSWFFAQEERLDIPTIGIGAGRDCDGQVLVLTDVLGLTPNKTPFYVKKYGNLAEEIRKIGKQFADDVRQKRFPKLKTKAL